MNAIRGQNTPQLPLRIAAFARDPAELVRLSEIRLDDLRATGDDKVVSVTSLGTSGNHPL